MTPHLPEFWSRYEPLHEIERTTGYRSLYANSGDTARFIVYEIDRSADVPSAAFSRVMHEVHRLSDIKDDCLLRPLEVENSDEVSLIVCPDANGERLSEVVKSKLSLSAILDITQSLLQVLHSVHDAGLVLRYLRPKDIYVQSSGDSLKAMVGGCPPLLLLECSDTNQLASDTLPYGAPETLGALEYDVRASADLYSLGIVLFECLAGHPPFQGETSHDLLFHHVTTPVPDLCELDASIPPTLNDIVRRLLQKHPRDRYQSATGALFDIQQVRATLCAEDEICPATPLVLGTKDHRESLIEPAHVGRDTDLKVLKSALRTVSASQSRSVLITAPSGIGKSRVLQETSTYAVAQGFRLLRGQGKNQPGLSPLATMQPAILAATELIRDDAALRTALQGKMQEYASELHAAAPELAIALQLEQPDTRDRALSDRRIAVALATLLGRLSLGGQPIVLLLDDAQWADDLTLAMLDCWQLTDPEQTLLIVSTRPSDDLARRLRNHIQFSAEISLAPLSRQDSDLLLESMAGVLPPEILETVWEMAAGNPFASSAVLRGLVEGSVLTPTDDGWDVDAERLRDIQMSGEAAEVLKERLVRLPVDSRKLLAIGAVLGKEFAIDTVAKLTGLSHQTAIGHLKSPRDLCLIWENEADGVCKFVHDQIREAVLATLSKEELAGIHLAAGEHIAETAPESHFHIACHFDAAGCPERALPSAVKAAASAQRRHALGIAIQQYEIALRSCQNICTELWFQILSGMGSVLMLSGRYAEAEPMLEAALLHAKSAMDEAEISLKLGELAFKRDDKDRAVARWETALRKLGGKLPPNWLMPFCTLKEIAVQTLHSLIPAGLQRAQKKEATLRDRLICRLYSRLAYGYWYLKGKVPLLFVHLRGMNLAENFAPTAELAQAYSEHAPAMSLIPLRNRGIAYGRRSLEIRTALGDVWGQGQSLHFLAIALYAAGRFEECIEVGSRSVRILDRAGDFWEKHIAQYQVAASLFRVGRLTEAVQLAREAYDSGLAVGDDQVCGNIIDVWARATNGDLPADIVQNELNRPRADVQGISHVLLARGVQLIAERKFHDASETFGEGIRTSRAAGITNCYTAPLYAWKATSLRRFLEEESPVIRRSRQKAICAHRRAAWVAFLVAIRFRGELPHALRELAWSFVFKNRVRRAMCLLKWSVRAAQAQSAKYESLQSELVLQQVRVERDYPDAREMLKKVEEGYSAFNNEQLPARVPTSLSLVDRFDSLLESGRKIASATEPADIVAMTIEASQQLLRSDYCRVVSISPDGEVGNISESVRPYMAHCLKTGVAEAAEAPNKQFRSLVVCPILVRGSAVAGLCVGNTEVRGLFGENELRIITYITTICGTALENAEGFRNLRRLNENLENIVTERTAVVEARSAELQETARSLQQTQIELAAARDKAEIANQAKTDFLAQMSHEIRTPIGAVLGFTELLLNGEHPLHPQQLQHLRRVQSNGAHLLQLLNDLLDLSKIEAGQLTIETVSCQPFTLISDILASLEARAIDKGLKLSLAITDTIPETIATDPTRLRQIITNLVGNAIKFTSAGGVDLVIGTDVDRGLMQIEVCDSGMGIPLSAQRNVFEPFQQADETVSRNFGGTGLGLPISRRLARALGGDLTVVSAPGEGSTFTTTIATGPLDDVRQLTITEAAAAKSQSVEKSVAPVDLSGIRILVTDDVLTNREFLSHMLRAANAEIETAENGQIAIDVWNRSGADLILMDMRMPVMDGYTAVELLRDLGAKVPIVALTANGLAEDEVRCRDAGCSGYLTKPVSMDALLTEVAEQLGITATMVPPPVVDGSTDKRSPVSGSTKPVKDATVAADFAIPEDPFFRGLASQLVSKLVETLPISGHALDTLDAETVAEQAHWMKGTGGTVGLPVITTIGIALENAAKARDFETARRVVEQLNSTVEQLQRRLVT